MSLLDEGMTKCVFLNKTTVPDGYGGSKTEWSEGAEFLAAVTFDASLQARVAEKQGVTGLYTVTTSKAVALDYHDVFKRLKTKLDDGTELPEIILRVTSKSDKMTPASAGIDMRQCTAEEWVHT